MVFGRRSEDEQAPAFVLPGYEKYPTVVHEVAIRDARPIASELSLDRERFELVEHESVCIDLRDPDELRDRYFEEMVPYIQRRFNADWVIPYRNGLIHRRAEGKAVPPGGWRGVTGPRGPAGFAHIDYAPEAGPMKAAAINQTQGIPIRPYSRLIIVQTWRALSPPPQDFPLAFCDAATVARTDLSFAEYVVSNTGQPDSAHRDCIVRFNPAQRWYYFPRMVANDLVLFTAYDSEAHYGPMSAHSAFDDRNTFPDAKPRESIEARFCVYYA
jgi:hypothetical protein